jgi:DNA polymerase-3 subunit delta
MKITQSQIHTHLKKELSSFYLVSGDEPLLVQEITSSIYQMAKQQGIEEKEVMHIDAGSDWGRVHQEAFSMSLFAHRRVLEIRIVNGKPSDKGACLLELIKDPNPDNVIVVICPKLDGSTQKTKWVRAFIEHGIFVPVWPIERHQYPSWLVQRLKKFGLSADQNVIDLLVSQTEGNILAASQEIEKFKMLGASHITLSQVEESIIDNARYDAFTLIDVCLQGDLPYAHKILYHLQQEGLEPIMILGAISLKVRQLIDLMDVPSHTLHSEFQKLRIWPKQQGSITAALQRLSNEQLFDCLSTIEKINRAVKGEGDNPWLLLNHLIGKLCGNELLPLKI